jgi:rhodanese-related sulfurtransferase
MKQITRKTAALAGLAALYFSPVSAESWNRIPLIRDRFPGVRRVSSAQLTEWMRDTQGAARLTIVDVRRPREFAVSHIQRALNLTSVAGVSRLRLAKNGRIVLYCSVGYRSSSMAEKLARAGYTQVFNLEGSLFAWANEGRPLFRGEVELKPAKVHPYNAKWGALMKPELWVEP